MPRIVSAAHRYLRQWCRRIAKSYDRWESRPFPFGDGV